MEQKTPVVLVEFAAAGPRGKTKPVERTRENAPKIIYVRKAKKEDE